MVKETARRQRRLKRRKFARLAPQRVQLYRISRRGILNKDGKYNMRPTIQNIGLTGTDFRATESRESQVFAVFFRDAAFARVARTRWQC